MPLRLFEPIQLRNITVRNRMWLSPMCMYSADRSTGAPGRFHVTHYHSRAQGGFGLIITEATAVSPKGRISPNDVGIWTGEHVQEWREVTKRVHREGSSIVVQLAHAGRKAGTYRGFPGEATGVVPAEDGGWTPVAPSAIAYPGYPVPQELSTADIDKIVDQFAAGARRAQDAHFDGVEIHAAHGYLIHQFLSPLSNQRTDEYGGSFDNRIRFLIKIVDAVRTQLDPGLIVMVRISGTDWCEGGWTIEESTKLAVILREHGVDLIDVSSGGNSPDQVINPEPGWQVPLAEQVKSAGIPVACVGMIVQPADAEAIIKNDRADVVLFGRAGLRDPYLPLRAATILGEPDAVVWPPQYGRARWGTLPV